MLGVLLVMLEVASLDGQLFLPVQAFLLPACQPKNHDKQGALFFAATCLSFDDKSSCPSRHFFCWRPCRFWAGELPFLVMGLFFRDQC